VLFGVIEPERAGFVRVLVPGVVRDDTVSVVPADRTSSAVRGSPASGSPLFKGTNARWQEMSTRLEIPGPMDRAANRKIKIF
jgi:hypothetical protein